MKRTRMFQMFGFILFISTLVIGCETDDNQTPDDFYDQGDFTIVLDAQKTPGQGQYRTVVESSDTIIINVHVEAPEELMGLTITKTVNLEVDQSFGNQGVIQIDASGTSFDYNFVYDYNLRNPPPRGLKLSRPVKYRQNTYGWLYQVSEEVLWASTG